MNQRTLTKQEKIREGLRQIIHDCEEPDGVDADRAVRLIIPYLHSQGAVVKAEGELPFVTSDFILSEHGVYAKVGRGALSEQGYVAVEPLIGEDDAD